MLSAIAALERLREGNRRYVAGEHGHDPAQLAARRQALVEGQEPFAIVLGCSDSRAPAELLFDQGLGDLFVIRVAGNVVAPSQVGSVEYAAEVCGARLVVVLGHTGCGAVTATLAQLDQPSAARSPNLRAIVERIEPAVAELRKGPLREDPDALLARAVRANVRASADHLRHGSAILERLIAEEGLRVVGAEYDLASGAVDFFDGAELARS